MTNYDNTRQSNIFVSVLAYGPEPFLVLINETLDYLQKENY